MLGQVDSFGERMADTPDSTRLGKAVGLGLVNLANSELAKLYTRAGETAEAQRAESRIQQVKDRQAGLWDLAGFYRSRTFRRAGFLVPGFGILAVLTGFFALASVLLPRAVSSKVGPPKNHVAAVPVLCRRLCSCRGAGLQRRFAVEFSAYRACFFGIPGC